MKDPSRLLASNQLGTVCLCMLSDGYNARTADCRLYTQWLTLSDE
jgi:hypothetical protein